MDRFRFSSKWIKWIMERVSPAHAFVLINGSPMEEYLGRGLRQGDPFLTFLFLIAAEWLNLMLNKAIVRGFYNPVLVGRDNIQISHLQFTDDTIFIGKASMENVLFLKRYIFNWEMVSGLKVNRDKCSVIGLNVNNEVMQAYANVLGCQVGDETFNYLGIKVGCAHRKATERNHVIQKIWNCMRK